jgi:N-acetylmuramic acid 6-phosphate etherase
LRGRSLVLLEQATGRSVGKCRRALDSADGELKTALVSLLADCPQEDARVALAAAHGDVRAAVDAADTNRQQTS